MRGGPAVEGDASDLPIAELGFPGPLRDRLVEAVLLGEKTETCGLLGTRFRVVERISEDP